MNRFMQLADDDTPPSPQEVDAKKALRALVRYADNLGEPIHPFVQARIEKALVRASRRKRS